MNDRVERIESVKAGSLSAIAAGVTYGVIIGIDRLIVSGQSVSGFSLAVEVANAIIGGFLFGVTYRYIIRTDRNHHLNSGAVLAFGLVRGLAQVNLTALDIYQIWWCGVIIAENILLFAVARYLLDYALAVRWVAPFKSS